MKTGQAEKFLKARQDPSFARAMQIKELSPQQSADQVRLRKVVQMTEARLAELEAGIGGLKRRTDRGSRDARKLHATSQPALERMQRTVRNIDVAIRDRQNAMDDLSRRINSLRLSRGGSLQPETHSRTRESTPVRASDPKSPSPSPKKTLASVSASTRSPKSVPARSQRARTVSFGEDALAHSTSGTAASAPPSLKPTDEQRARASRALGARVNIKVAASTARVTKVPQKNVASSSSLVAHASVARGPVSLDAAPVPGSLKGKAKARASTSPVVATPAAPAAPVSAVPAPFAQPAAPPMGSLGLGRPPATSAPAPAAPPASTAPPATPAAVPGAFPASSPSPGGFGFGAIKLDLDPGTVVSTPGSRRAGGGGNRSHTSAAKLSTTPTRAPGAPTGTLFGGVVSPPKDDSKKPAGFFG